MLRLGSVRIAKDEGHVSKSGKRVRGEESRAHQFAQSLGLPVPAVHDVTSSGEETDIVMDFVDGQCLEEAWPSMTPEQKRSIAEQVGAIVTAMRQAVPNQSTIGAFGGPFHDLRRFASQYGGPFSDEAGFNDFILDFYPGTPPLVRSTISEAHDVNNRIVFTHGDLSPRTSSSRTVACRHCWTGRCRVGCLSTGNT